MHFGQFLTYGLSRLAHRVDGYRFFRSRVPHFWLFGEIEFLCSQEKYGYWKKIKIKKKLQNDSVKAQQ